MCILTKFRPTLLLCLVHLHGYPINLMKFTKVTLYILFLIIMASCSPEEDFYSLSTTSELSLEENIISIYGDFTPLILPNSNELDKIPADPKNTVTLSKIKLGKLLFHETGLAINPTKQIGLGTYSCASCHHAKAGFQSGTKQGIGEGG